MINNKKGSEKIVNIVSIIVTVVIILVVGVIYYIFFSPDKLELDEIEYTKIDESNYEIDKEFEQGLDTTVDIRYTDRELDMHRDLKDYYQGREDPFSPDDDRNSGIELDPERVNDNEEIRYSKPDAVTKQDKEEEIKIDDTASSVAPSGKSILNF